MKYIPASTVLPEYTDEALTAERVFKGEVARALLTVPAEFRQPAEAEVNNRATRIRHVNGMARVDMVADFGETRHEVLAEVLDQLAREAS